METATSIYEEIGLAPVINAMGHYTVLGGSTPSPRVKAAMEQAERHYVDMAQLHASLKLNDIVLAATEARRHRAVFLWQLVQIRNPQSEIRNQLASARNFCRHSSEQK